MIDEKKTEEEIKLAEETKVDEAKVEEEKLISTVSEKLAETFGESVDDSTPAEEKPAEESTEEKEESAEKPADNSTEEFDETDDSTPVKEESTEEKPAEESDETDDSTSKDDSTDGPKLSEAYYRAAIHQGWKPQEIKDFLSKDSDLATRTFAKIYDSTNKLSREFANIGRYTKQEAAKKDAEPVKKDEPVQKPESKEIDIEKLRKDYNDDPVIELVAQQQEQVKILRDQIQGMTKEPDPSVKDEATIRANIQAEASLEQQITTFFGGNDLKMYDDFYGELPKDAKNWDTLTKDQKINRWQVLEMADQMLIGASSQGREMDVDEALTLAHLSISEPTREKVIRNEIKAKVVKRNKSLTLKPSGGKKPDIGKPTTEQELIDVTRERLNKIYK